MENLLKVLKEFSKEDIERLESFDRQYRALKKLHKEIKNPPDFLKLVVINQCTYVLPASDEGRKVLGDFLRVLLQKP